MRAYLAELKKSLVDITHPQYADFLNPDPDFYPSSQAFAKQIHDEKHWGLLYPSVRDHGALCMAIFRPPALTIPIQGCHLQYIWDGTRIAEVCKVSRVNNF